METYKELKEFCDDKMKEFPHLEKMYKKEIGLAKRYYNNKRNLYKELCDKPIKRKLIIPFLLGITDKVEEESFDMVQVFEGSSGGIDIDIDFSTETKAVVFEYLRDKYGEDRVINVGTFMRLKLLSSIKDVLKVYKVDFKEVNAFTKIMDSELSFEENIKNIKENDKINYLFYEKHKDLFDIALKFNNKTRQVGKHAGGVIILDRPVYEKIPVERVNDVLVTAFPESGSEQVLDEIGIVKFDILGITILDVIKNTFEDIEEKIFLIEEDGIEKIVPESYIQKKQLELKEPTVEVAIEVEKELPF